MARKRPGLFARLGRAITDLVTGHPVRAVRDVTQPEPQREPQREQERERLAPTPKPEARQPAPPEEQEPEPSLGTPEQFQPQTGVIRVILQSGRVVDVDVTDQRNAKYAVKYFYAVRKFLQTGDSTMIEALENRRISGRVVTGPLAGQHITGRLEGDLDIIEDIGNRYDMASDDSRYLRAS